MTWMRTHSGLSWDHANPDAFNISLIDINNALHLTNRWGGHTLRRYPVAEHLIIGHLYMMDFVTDDPLTHCYWLLHDAEEAYTTDMPRPMQRFLNTRFDGFTKFWAEYSLQVRGLIHEHVGLDFYPPDHIAEIIRLVDDRMLLTEARDIMEPGQAFDGMDHVEAIPRDQVEILGGEQFPSINRTVINNETYYFGEDDNRDWLNGLNNQLRRAGLLDDLAADVARAEKQFMRGE